MRILKLLGVMTGTYFPPLLFSFLQVTRNGRFQHLMEASRQFDTNTPLKERVRVNMSLINLMNDFIMIASTYGKIIVSEGYLPDHLKTIRPQELGGIAVRKKQKGREI